MQTNIPNVFAAGDVVSFPVALLDGERSSIHHQQVAEAHGETVRHCAFQLPSQMGAEGIESQKHQGWKRPPGSSGGAYMRWRKNDLMPNSLIVSLYFWIRSFNIDASDLLTLLYLIRTPKTSMKGVEQNRKKASESRVSNKAVPGV